MRQISLTINDNEFDKFMSVLKSFKSAKNIASAKVEDNVSTIFGLTEEHKKIIDQRITKHFNGESKSSTWDEVKENARKANK